MIAQVQRDFKRPEGVAAEDMDANAEGEVMAVLDLRADDSLRDAGMAREVVNRVQKLRKKAGLQVGDCIPSSAGILQCLGLGVAWNCYSLATALASIFITSKHLYICSACQAAIAERYQQNSMNICSLVNGQLTAKFAMLSASAQMIEPGIAVQASDLVDIFVGSASSADAGTAAKQSLVEQLLDSQVPLPSPSSFFHCQHTGLVFATPKNS